MAAPAALHAPQTSFPSPVAAILSGMEADIRSRTICLAEVVPLVDFGDATPAVARIESSYHDL